MRKGFWMAGAVAITLLLSGCKWLDKLKCQSTECSGELDCNEMQESDYTGAYSGYVYFNEGSGNLEQQDDEFTLSTGSNSNDGILEGTSNIFGSFRIRISPGDCRTFTWDSTSLTHLKIQTNNYYKLNSFANDLSSFDGCGDCTNTIYLGGYLYSDSSAAFSNYHYEISISGSLYRKF